jgi:RNA polymerase sigma-70 factor (ECF subfamily)
MLGGLAGDGRAYRTLLSELSGYLRGYFGKRLGSSPADVEDLVQETLLAVHTRRDTYDPGQPFTAWAYGVARYKLIDKLRGRVRREGLHDELSDELFVEPETDAADARRDLMALLGSLPEGQRAPIILTKLEGFSVEEAAARTGQSVSSIKVSVHRGLKKLAALVVAS